MELSNVIALVCLALGLLGHIITTVWWASKITNILENAQRSLAELSLDMKAVNITYVRKEDFAKEMAHHEKRLDAAWDKIDILNAK